MARGLDDRHLRALSLLLVLLIAAPLQCAAQEEPPPAALGTVDRDRRQAILPTPPPVAPGAPLISINGSLRAGVQWIVNPPRARDDVFGVGALDLVLAVRPAPNVTFSVDVEALGGLGPDQALGSLSRVQADAERLDGDEGRVFLREAWVRLQFLDGHVRFNVGKLDAGQYFDRNFFAEDETRQFLNAALLANPLLRPPPNGPGAAIRISQGDWRYAFGVHAPDDFDGDFSGLPYVVAELGRRNIFPLRGHYRWWARVGSVPDRRQDVTWATGVSVDQLVAAGTGVFVRAGLARSDGESLTSHAWSLGVQHTPSWLGRTRDLVGLGYGVQREAAGRERVGEVYYNASLAECCSVIANVEWILEGPNQITARRNHNAVVPGLRAVILF